MEFKTFTEKKSRELNVDSEKIKASDQIEKFERKITDSSNNIKEINSEFDIEKYQVVQSLDELKQWNLKAENMGYIAFDTETNSLDAIKADMVGFSLCTSENDACYVPLLHDEEENKQDDEDIEMVVTSLKRCQDGKL